MSKHDDVARRIARKNNTQYNRGKGADVEASGRTIEVESKNSIGEAEEQLADYEGLTYVAGTDKEATDSAKELYEDSHIGVMDSRGNIVQPAKRR